MVVMAPHGRSNDVGGVETAAETDLDNGHLDARRAKELERRGRRRLEERRRHAQLAARLQRAAQSSTLGDRTLEHGHVDSPYPDGETLGDVSEMRRGVARRADAAATRAAWAMAATDPLPLVPRMLQGDEKLRSGGRGRPQSREMFSRPSLIPNVSSAKRRSSKPFGL
jgi:hypothetical protein